MSIRTVIATIALTVSGCAASASTAPPPETPQNGTTPTATSTAPTATATPAEQQTPTEGPGGLVIGGDQANFGIQALESGFVPDPHDVTIVSGGDIDAGTLSLGEGCNGWVTRTPDAIVRLSSASSMLRFYVTAGNDDTTLVINAADGSYHCNDDSYGGRNPSVDIANAGAGQYDVWIGSYQQGVRASGVLHVTELASQHP